MTTKKSTNEPINQPKILSNDLDQAPKVGIEYEQELNSPEVRREIIHSFNEYEGFMSRASSSIILSCTMSELEKIRNSIQLITLESEDICFKDFQEHMKYYYLLITKRPFDSDISIVSQHPVRFRISNGGAISPRLKDYMSNFKTFNVSDFANIYNNKLNEIQTEYQELIREQDESNLDSEKIIFKKKFMTKNVRSLFIELWMGAKVFLEASILYKDYENEKFLKGREELLFDEVKKMDDILKKLN